MSEPLNLTVSLRGTRELHKKYQIIRLTGLLDAFSESTLRKVLGECVETDSPNLVLDLSKIDNVDSSGLGALVQIYKKATENKGSLQIVTNLRVTQTVKLARLDKFFTLHPSLEAAIAASS
ncbi:MAG: STAS domain-containing protein [Cyanobacteria bacterium P01_H01_bin.15]